MSRLIAALALAALASGCAAAPTPTWCEDYAARTDVSRYVSPDTGRLERDPTTNEVVDPYTGEIAVKDYQEACLRRQAERAIERFGNRLAP